MVSCLKLANGKKAKIRNIMSALFQHALSHQFITVNPIRGLIRQNAQQKDPDGLDCGGNSLDSQRTRQDLDRELRFEPG